MTKPVSITTQIMNDILKSKGELRNYKQKKAAEKTT
jgi:hypothetical protein